jgi:Flp pilus assembly protein TadD
MQQDADAEPLLISERELSALDELGFGWVVLNERWLARHNADAIHGYLTQLFGLPERYAGDGVSVWDVRGRGPLRQGAGPYEWLYPRSPAAEAALAEAERTFPVEPGGPGPWEEAGRLALAAGEPEKAERYLARAVESGSRDAELIVHWMLLRFRGRRWDEVVEVAPAVIEGRTLAAPFAAAFARVAAAQIATHEGGDPTGCKELAAVCLRENQVREALPCLEAQRAQGTADAATEALLGQAYEALGWPSLALDAYRRAQALDPGVEVDLSRVLVPDTEHLVAGRP